MSHELRTPLNSILILGPAAHRQSGRQSHRQAGRVRPHHPRRRHRPAQPDQRHSRPVQDRIGNRHGRCRGDRVHQPARHGRASVPARGRHAAAVVRGQSRSQSRPQHHHRSRSACSRCSRTCCRTPSSSPRRAACGSTSRRRRAAGAAEHPVLKQAPPSSPSRSPTPASAFRSRSRRSSSRPSSRPTPAPAASTAAPAWVWRSAASCRTCWAAKSSCAARPAWAAPSRSTCRCDMSVRPRRRGSAACGRRHADGTSPSLHAAGLPERAVEQIPDDRLEIQPGDSILLIVEDDPHYARVMVDLARDKGFKVLVAMRGADALDLAKQYQPTAVSLDVFLPDMLGWTVLSQLKQNPLTRHIPVQIITLDEDRQHGLARGAFSFVTKPTSTEGVKAALSRIKEYAKPPPQTAAGGGGRQGRADEHRRAARPRRHRDRDRRHRRRGAVARSSRTRATASCSIFGCPTCPGSRCWSELRADVSLSDVPVVVFTGRELSAEEDAQLHTMARSIVVKGRRVARAAARRDRAVPAPHRDRPAAREAAHARAAQQLRRGPGRPHGAAGRR